ncbi:MAG: YitT family protein [Oscillospiraceae bacterium]|nr:YitT family protein [Oscillospiraceae bacterium]
MKDRTKVRESILRLLILFVGLTIAHLGVTLFLLADQGADPFNVLIQGLRLLLEKAGLFLTHGTVHMGVCFLIILILLLADRRYIKAGTVVCMFCGGPIIDFFTWLLQRTGIGQAALPVKILVLVLGCGILAFGMTIVIRSEAGTGPNDLVTVVISEKSGLRFGIVRIAADFSFVLVGFLLGGRFGIGTIICAFLVGPVADFCMPASSSFVSRCLRRFGR